MTRQESNALARLEEKVDLMPQTIIEKLDERYITRREGKVASWFVGVAISVIALFAYFRGAH